MNGMMPSNDGIQLVSLFTPCSNGTNTKLLFRNFRGAEMAHTPAILPRFSAAKCNANAPPLEKPMTQT